MSNILDDVNRTKVSAELLGEVLKMHAALPPEDRGVFEVRAIRLFELLDSKNLNEDRGLLSMAIDFRLTALARLEHDAALRGWSLPGTEPGMISISFDVLKAVAEEPLIENAEQQAAFDLDSFRRRVLTNAETVGRA